MPLWKMSYISRAASCAEWADPTLERVLSVVNIIRLWASGHVSWLLSRRLATTFVYQAQWTWPSVKSPTQTCLQCNSHLVVSQLCTRAGSPRRVSLFLTPYLGKLEVIDPPKNCSSQSSSYIRYDGNIYVFIPWWSHTSKKTTGVYSCYTPYWG